MITRENYEEFFLSYVDNELPAETRLAVEHFIAANPDLREELETLLQCRLEPASDAVFPDKGSLLQYEESLLLYVDGELDEAGWNTVEELTRRDPHFAQELSRLQHTVSRPDTAIAFPGKESLYRPVKRRVVSMPWLQAAAAVVAVVVLLVLPRGHKADIPDGVVVKNKPAAVTPPAASPLYSKKDDASKDGHPVYAEAPAGGKERMKTLPTKTPTLPAPAVAATSPANTTSQARATSAMDPVPSDNAIASTQATAASDPTTTLHPQKAAATSVAVVNIPKEQRSFATQALLREAQEASDGDMADNMPPETGKTKLRGLFRRVTRAFGKTADRDDDGQRQVSISVFQVALK